MLNDEIKKWTQSKKKKNRAIKRIKIKFNKKNKMA
jgi:hypothetical protein